MLGSQGWTTPELVLAEDGTSDTDCWVKVEVVFSEGMREGPLITSLDFVEASEEFFF